VSTLIFIPAWNEAESIASVVADVRVAIPDADILVVNDGSTDETGSLPRRPRV
jgi:glycosyltransferase involved in cell wall biosynthesis